LNEIFFQLWETIKEINKESKIEGWELGLIDKGRVEISFGRNSPMINASECYDRKKKQKFERYY